MSRHSHSEINLSNMTPRGRQALRGWYRFYRREWGCDVGTAREIIDAMRHASAMGASWRGF